VKEYLKTRRINSIMPIIKARTRAPVELFDKGRLLRVIREEVVEYYADVFDAAQQREFRARLSRADHDTPFASLVPNFDGGDALGLRYHLAHRLGVPENDLPNPDPLSLHTYTIGQAVQDLRQAAGLRD
jgi:hypothetical protein